MFITINTNSAPSKPRWMYFRERALLFQGRKVNQLTESHIYAFSREIQNTISQGVKKREKAYMLAIHELMFEYWNESLKRAGFRPGFLYGQVKTPLLEDESKEENEQEKT